jgi:hypothetical protein
MYNQNHPGQRWRIVYTDKVVIETKGRDKYYGFRRNQEFYLRSKLPMQRVIECVGANNAVIKRWYNNRKAQRWIFDPISKTIRNRNWTSYSLSQEGANLRCRSMNSRWF